MDANAGLPELIDMARRDGVLPPEPEPPTHTPWGRVQHRTRRAEGLWAVSTPRHGGFWLSPLRVNAIRRRWQATAWRPTTGSWTWLEEDCDAHLVPLTWPDLFGAESVRACAEMVESMAKHLGGRWRAIAAALPAE